jgi:NCS1 family nucleobase:cation symporter-1
MHAQDQRSSLIGHGLMLHAGVCSLSKGKTDSEDRQCIGLYSASSKPQIVVDWFRSLGPAFSSPFSIFGRSILWFLQSAAHKFLHRLAFSRRLCVEMALRNFLNNLEVKPTDDEFESIETTRWGNKDVYPIPHDKRTYTWLAFYAYWGTCGISLSSWTIGSSLIGIGLTAGQACGVVLVGCVIASISAYLNGAAGAIHHLGYGALARAAFGLWGSYFVVMLNVFQSFVFYGTQMYFGGPSSLSFLYVCVVLTFAGMAFVIILNSIFSTLLNMANTLPANAGITTPQLIGFILFICLYFPVIYFIPPHQVQKFLEVNLVISGATLLGIMGWAVHANGGAGDLVSPAVAIPKGQVGFLMIQGITSVAGT